MWDAVGLSVLTLVSILIGYGMGKDKTKPAEITYNQNIYTPEALRAADIYDQTKKLIEEKGEGNDRQ